MPLVLDTGPLYSSLDRSDPDHVRVIEVLRQTPRPHFIVEPVLVEVDYWTRKFLDATAFQALAEDIVGGRYELVCVEPGDVQRAAALEREYEDARLGFVDAAVMAVCERLDLSTVLTFDRRHFELVRLRHRPFLELLP